MVKIVLQRNLFEKKHLKVAHDKVSRDFSGNKSDSARERFISEGLISSKEYSLQPFAYNDTFFIYAALTCHCLALVAFTGLGVCAMGITGTLN